VIGLKERSYRSSHFTSSDLIATDWSHFTWTECATGRTPFGQNRGRRPNRVLPYITLGNCYQSISGYDSRPF